MGWQCLHDYAKPHPELQEQPEQAIPDVDAPELTDTESYSPRDITRSGVSPLVLPVLLAEPLRTHYPNQHRARRSRSAEHRSLPQPDRKPHRSQSADLRLNDPNFRFIQTWQDNVDMSESSRRPRKRSGMPQLRPVEEMREQLTDQEKALLARLGVGESDWISSTTACACGQSWAVKGYDKCISCITA